MSALFFPYRPTLCKIYSVRHFCSVSRSEGFVEDVEPVSPDDPDEGGHREVWREGDLRAGGGRGGLLLPSGDSQGDDRPQESEEGSAGQEEYHRVASQERPGHCEHLDVAPSEWFRGDCVPLVPLAPSYCGEYLDSGLVYDFQQEPSQEESEDVTLSVKLGIEAVKRLILADRAKEGK